MKSPPPWLSRGRPLCYVLALLLCATAAAGCGDDSSPPPPAGLAASVIGEWRPSGPELDRIAALYFSGLRRSFSPKASGDQDLAALHAILAGVSVEKAERLRAMTDTELLAYARSQASTQSLRFSKGGKAEHHGMVEGQFTPATWRVEGVGLVLEAAKDFPGEGPPRTVSITIRFKLAEDVLVVEDVQLTGVEEKDGQESLPWLPRTWHRAASRDG